MQTRKMANNAWDASGDSPLVLKTVRMPSGLPSPFSAYSPLLSWHHQHYHDGSDYGENDNCDYYYSSEDKRMKRMTPKHTICPSLPVNEDDNDNEDVVDEDDGDDDDDDDDDDDNKKYL